MNTETHTALDPVTGPLVCMRQLASDGLPAVPSDPSGRHMSWVLVLDSAATHYRGELRKWNLASIVAAFGSYTAGGYEPPVLAEHDPGVTRGERLGDLVELRLHDGGVIGLVRWVSATAAESIASGAIRYMSPGIGRVELHDTGEVIETIFEISVVTSPHQARGAATHVLAKRADAHEAAMSDQLALDVPDVAIVETPDTVTLAAVEAPQPTDDGNARRDSEIAALRSELAEMKRAAAFAEFCAEVEVGSTLTVTAETQKALFALRQQDESAFATLAATAQKPATLSAVVEKPRIVWGARHGSSDVTEPETAPTNSIELKAACLRETGGDQVKATALFIERAPKMGIL
jgi:hypothetical protein